MNSKKDKTKEEPRVAAIFLPYYRACSARTRRRQRKELAALSVFARTHAVDLGDLLAESAGWAELTSSLIRAYLESMRSRHYKASSVAIQGYTFRRYAALAMEAGVMPPLTYAEIVAVPLPTSEQEVVFLSLTAEQVQQLIAPPLTLGRHELRDSLCMALLLLCGLWPQSIVSLDRASINLTERTMTFYDYYARQWQVRRLDSQTLALATQYLALPSPYRLNMSEAVTRGNETA